MDAEQMKNATEDELAHRLGELSAEIDEREAEKRRIFEELNSRSAPRVGAVVEGFMSGWQKSMRGDSQKDYRLK